MIRTFIVLLSLVIPTSLQAQSSRYTNEKNQKLSRPSPFESIVSDSTNRELVYIDEYVAAFEPLRKQAPVHLLIVPKERIYTANEITADHDQMLPRLFLAARRLAKKYGIAESGYRLTINTNEDSGQSVFHLHMHLLGGMKLGPMMSQTYKDPIKK